MHAAHILMVHQKNTLMANFMDLLHTHKYQVAQVHNDKHALRILHTQKIDAVVVDLDAADFCAFELGRCIKDIPELSTIPVLFVHSDPCGSTDHKKSQQAFAAGAVDFWICPFDIHEALARLHTHIHNGRMQHDYLQRNTLLRQQNLELLRQVKKLQVQNKDLDAFAHTVAHELKNTLNSLHDYAWLLEQDYSASLDSEGHSAFKRLGGQILKMSDIIDALLLLAGTSRQENLCCDKIYMEMIMDKVWERLDDKIKFYHAIITAPSTWPPVMGHPAWVEEIWVNYISNALKYGGTPPQIELGYEIRRKNVRFWVADNGAGLDEEQKSRLFKPFTRLQRERAEGHGLGLSIVKNMVHKLGGKVWVKSKPGRGSRFYFSLPIRSYHAASTVVTEDDFIFERILRETEIFQA
jgi:two-component system, sensor histidine kinase and response regulator